MKRERVAGRIERFWERTFLAAQRLECVGDAHQAAKLHGHTFKLRVFATGDVDPASDWVVDPEEMAAKIDAVVGLVDHQYLNDVDGLDNPSSEGVCHFLAARLSLVLPTLSRLELWENGQMGVAFDVSTEI